MDVSQSYLNTAWSPNGLLKEIQGGHPSLKHITYCGKTSMEQLVENHIFWTFLTSPTVANLRSRKKTSTCATKQKRYLAWDPNQRPWLVPTFAKAALGTEAFAEAFGQTALSQAFGERVTWAEKITGRVLFWGCFWRATNTKRLNKQHAGYWKHTENINNNTWFVTWKCPDDLVVTLQVKNGSLGSHDLVAQTTV